MNLVEESESGFFFLTCLFLLAAVLGQALKFALVQNKTLSYLPVFFLLSALPFLVFDFIPLKLSAVQPGETTGIVLYLDCVKSWNIKKRTAAAGRAQTISSLC